ncbi:hypothetical protein TWF694_011613 [Orbilia ellipsospora]|uniref:F-box domain-containing protein n=1 Tax=Orbilia ellipsospora TaxID=2528407 RepID=A0AAV9X748_9PEZI
MDGNIKNLKRPRSPSEELGSNDSDHIYDNRLGSPSATPIANPLSPRLNLGLPEFLAQNSPPNKRVALTSPTDEPTPTRVTRHAAAVSVLKAATRDPFDILPDNVVRSIIFLLSNKNIVALRRVSKFWKANVEYVVSQAVVERSYGGRAITETLKTEGKLGWPEFAFRKNTFLDESRAEGAPTSVKKFTNAQLWDIVGERLVWIDEANNLNVQHLSAWDVNERKDSLVALAGNPRAFSKNKFLHSVVAKEQRKARVERPKRAAKMGKIPEAIIIRWSLRDTLKNRRQKVKVNFMVPCGTTHILLDYYQCDDLVQAGLWTNRLLPHGPSRNKLACINVITGYADWNITLDFPLAFPPSHALYLRPRYQFSSSTYMINDDKVYAFTSPREQHTFGQHPNSRKLFLTVRDLKTGAALHHRQMTDLEQALGPQYFMAPEHSLVSPDGKYIILSINRALWICDAQNYTFIEKVDLPWLQHTIVGSKYDLEFSTDGSRLYLTEECNGLDFNVLELDCAHGFKPVFIRSYHVPAKTTFVSRTSFNHKLQTQVLTTRNPAQPMSGEWRPEILKFMSMDELMEGVPEELWGAVWKSKLPNPDDKWNWNGPNVSILNNIPAVNHASAIISQLTQIAGQIQGTTLPAQITLLGLSHTQVFGGYGLTDDITAVTPRGKIFLETPRKDYVMVSKNPITLPPLSKVQPNAIQEPVDDYDHTEWREDGVFYTGPIPMRNTGPGGRRKRKRAAKLDEGQMDERREWWIGGRMTPFKIKNGERFVMFDQDDTVYCCDFGPVGW